MQRKSIAFVMGQLPKKLVTIRNGNRAGIKILQHMERPFITAAVTSVLRKKTDIPKHAIKRPIRTLKYCITRIFTGIPPYNSIYID